MTTIELEPDTVFIVECSTPIYGTTWVECPDAESAYCARWQLPRDGATMGTTVRIINILTNQVVFDSAA